MSGKPKAKEKTVNAKAFHNLQQAETKYRSIFENAAEGMFQKENKAGDLFPRNKGGTNISQNSGYRLIYLLSAEFLPARFRIRWAWNPGWLVCEPGG